ncbi:hypothetical protein AYI68_g143 [Smittium mucronatum]|uniref:Uncharacterized protein n=1 Tax=Smittium mucronatum TaxID=133383 RepID=A0A1R0H979_9FUNG|nr:hypothetical protein AYI68_g143 [Smittium mucronatum]
MFGKNISKLSLPDFNISNKQHKLGSDLDSEYRKARYSIDKPGSVDISTVNRKASSEKVVISSKETANGSNVGCFGLTMFSPRNSSYNAHHSLCYPVANSSDHYSKVNYINKKKSSLKSSKRIRLTEIYGNSYDYSSSDSSENIEPISAQKNATLKTYSSFPQNPYHSKSISTSRLVNSHSFPLKEATLNSSEDVSILQKFRRFKNNVFMKNGFISRLFSRKPSRQILKQTPEILQSSGDRKYESRNDLDAERFYSSNGIHSVYKKGLQEAPSVPTKNDSSSSLCPKDGLTDVHYFNKKPHFNKPGPIPNFSSVSDPNLHSIHPMLINSPCPKNNNQMFHYLDKICTSNVTVIVSLRWDEFMDGIPHSLWPKKNGGIKAYLSPYSQSSSILARISSYMSIGEINLFYIDIFFKNGHRTKVHKAVQISYSNIDNFGVPLNFKEYLMVLELASSYLNSSFRFATKPALMVSGYSNNVFRELFSAIFTLRSFNDKQIINMYFKSPAAYKSLSTSFTFSKYVFSQYQSMFVYSCVLGTNLKSCLSSSFLRTIDSICNSNYIMLKWKDALKDLPNSEYLSINNCLDALFSVYNTLTVIKYDFLNLEGPKTFIPGKFPLKDPVFFGKVPTCDEVFQKIEDAHSFLFDDSSFSIERAELLYLSRQRPVHNSLISDLLYESENTNRKIRSKIELIDENNKKFLSEFGPKNTSSPVIAQSSALQAETPVDFQSSSLDFRIVTEEIPTNHHNHGLQIYLNGHQIRDTETPPSNCSTVLVSSDKNADAQETNLPNSTASSSLAAYIPSQLQRSNSDPSFLQPNFTQAIRPKLPIRQR